MSDFLEDSFTLSSGNVLKKSLYLLILLYTPSCQLDDGGNTDDGLK